MMNKFGLIFRHYLRRTFMEKISLFANLLLPIVLIFLFVLVQEYQVEDVETLLLNGTNNFLHTIVVVQMLFFFQVFGAFYNVDNLHELATSETKWRLNAAPINRLVFQIAAIAGGWLVSLLQTLLIIGVMSIFLNIYWGSMGINILALLAISLFSQILGVFLFVITKNKTQGYVVTYPIVFGLGALSGFLIPIRELVNLRIVDFLADWSPLTLAMDSVAYGGTVGPDRYIDLVDGVVTYGGGDMSIAIRNILIISAIAIALAVASYAIGKVRKIW